jgi:predicted RecA/RadA family phage recombinase
MKNYVQDGKVIEVAAPYALTSGQGALVGSLFGVAAGDAANGATVQLKTKGVFDITALTTDTGTVGTKMYWDNTNKRLTTTSTSNTLVGCLTAAKAGTDTTARVYLDGAIR